MEKYFKPISRSQVPEVNEVGTLRVGWSMECNTNQVLFVQEKKARRKRIAQHLNQKYDTEECIIIEDIPSEQSASPSPASKSPYFTPSSSPVSPKKPPNSKFCVKASNKRSFNDLTEESEPDVMSSQWPSTKRFKPQSKSNLNPVFTLLITRVVPEPQQQQEKKIITYVASNSPDGSLTRAMSGINGFQEANRRRRFKDKLYQGKSLASLNQTPWASAPTKIKPQENGMKAKLTAEQKKVIALALDGVSLFFTGSAGTGKSFVLRVMVEELQLKHGYSSVFVTASTGMAGCNIQGVTLHSFAGLGLARGTKEDLAEQIKKKKHVIQRWNRANVLIIDEISMISADFFTKVEYVARKFRECEKPFGGLQVVRIHSMEVALC